METGSRRGDVKAAMTFILGGRADHGRPSLEFVANDPASVASLALKDNLPPRKLRGTWSSAEGLMSGAASPGRCWPRAAPIACLRLRQRRKEFWRWEDEVASGVCAFTNCRGDDGIDAKRSRPSIGRTRDGSRDT